MSDELDSRVRALSAERLRPARAVASRRDPVALLDELIAVLASLFVFPPDSDSRGV